MIIRIDDNGKPIISIQAIGDNGTQYEIVETVYAKQGGRPTSTIKHGVITREKDESDKAFASRILQQASE